MDNIIEDNFENTAIIVSDGCCVQLGNLQVLDDVTFSINKGKKVAVVGPNGGGKSTFAKLLAGKLKAMSGVITKNNNLRGNFETLNLINTISTKNKGQINPNKPK